MDFLDCVQDVRSEAIRELIASINEQALEDTDLDAEGYYREMGPLAEGLDLPCPKWPYEGIRYLYLDRLCKIVASNQEKRLKEVLPGLLNLTWPALTYVLEEPARYGENFNDWPKWILNRHIALRARLNILTDLAELHAKAGHLTTIGPWDGLETFVDVRTFFKWALAQGLFVPPAIQGALIDCMDKEERFELAREYARNMRREGATVAEIAQALSKEDNPKGVFKFSREDVGRVLRPDMEGKPKAQLATEGKHLATGRRKKMTC